MRSDKFANSLSIQCSICGGTAFEYEAGTGPSKCVGCSRTFENEQLLRENGEMIDSEIRELVPDLAKHARDELHKMLRRTISGSKHFELK